jgi:hypothetical protein
VKRLLAVSLLCCALLSPVRAETPLLEPQDLGVLLYRQSDSFLPLELQRVARQERSPFFSSTAEEYLLIPGSRSPVRFPSGQRPVLYLRVILDQDDPRAGVLPRRDPTRFSLVALQATEKERKLTLARLSLTSTTRLSGQPLLVRLYGEQCFQLSPAEELPPGEYAIRYLPKEPGQGEPLDLFCFGVDP